MNKLFFIGLILFVSQVCFAQSPEASIQINDLESAKRLEALGCDIPDVYTVTRFVLVCRRDGIDPIISYNTGGTLSERSLQKLSKLQPGDTIEVKDIYARKTGSKSQTDVLLPAKRLVVK